MNDKFEGRLGIIQRVLPDYRIPLIDLLSEHCAAGASIFAGDPLPVENIQADHRPQNAQYRQARNLHFSTPSSPLYICWQSGIIPWLEDWQPDALIVEANPRYLSTPRAVRWMHQRGGIVLGWGLGVPSNDGLLNTIIDHRRTSFLQSLDGIIAYSHQGAREYIQAGVTEERVFVAHNAVSRRPERVPAHKPDEFTGRPHILFVGRLQERKRIDLLMQACARLPQDLQPEVTIIGEGPAREFFQQQARKHYPTAEFTGAVHGEELTPYFEQADLFVLPGTGGLAVQQTMAFGLPVIVAQGDGTQADLVRHANGWLVPPDDRDALTDALREALSDAGRLREMGKESFRIVREEINLDMMAQSFIHALKTVRGSALR